MSLTHQVDTLCKLEIMKIYFIKFLLKKITRNGHNLRVSYV